MYRIFFCIKWYGSLHIHIFFYTVKQTILIAPFTRQKLIFRDILQAKKVSKITSRIHTENSRSFYDFFKIMKNRPKLVNVPLFFQK
jgi:hypothetical protein